MLDVVTKYLSSYGWLCARLLYLDCHSLKACRHAPFPDKVQLSHACHWIKHLHITCHSDGSNHANDEIDDTATWLWSWWRHQMETFSALLALCVGNSLVTSEFPSQWPVMQCFDVFFDLRLNSKQSRRWWFETPSCSFIIMMSLQWYQIITCITNWTHSRHTLRGEL